MRWLLVGGLCLVCLGCMPKEELPPAVPDAPRLVAEKAEPASFLPESAAPPPSPPLPPMEQHSAALIIVPSSPEWKIQEVPTEKPLRPDVVIDTANKEARIKPTRKGYAEGLSVTQRYPYRPGGLYEVYTSPDNPTTIILPPGERLAAAPALNPDAWDVGVAEMGTDGQRQEVVVVRAVAAGQEATTQLLSQSGHTFFLWLRSFQKTSMVAVTWDMPLRLIPPLDAQTTRGVQPFKAPVVDVTRIHTGYQVESVKGKPPWLPELIYDDGRKTLIKFKESLAFTNAPVVFVVHTDGSPGVVDVTPYEVPEHPEKGAFYIIQGLWPRLTLKGTDGMEVVLTRTDNQVKPFLEVPRAR